MEILLFISRNSGKGGLKHLIRKLGVVKDVSYSLPACTKFPLTLVGISHEQVMQVKTWIYMLRVNTRVWESFCCSSQSKAASESQLPYLLWASSLLLRIHLLWNKCSDIVAFPVSQTTINLSQWRRTPHLHLFQLLCNVRWNECNIQWVI